MVVRPQVPQTLLASEVTIPSVENVTRKVSSESEHPYSLVRLSSSSHLLCHFSFLLPLPPLSQNKQNKTLPPTFDICYLVPFEI